MKIFIVGLGCMGAAYALKLTQKGHQVTGMDLNPEHHRFAYEKGLINNSSDASFEGFDVVICALPIQATLDFLKTHESALSKIPLVTDVSGLKRPLFERPIGISHFISHHPMTGKETSGPAAYDQVDFHQKNVVCIHHSAGENAENLLMSLLTDLGFNPPVWMNAQDHDQAITFTSHLPHVLAALYMHHPQLETFKGAAGNSFHETTRFAAMNPDLWTELFTSNQGNLLETIGDFIALMKDFEKHLRSERDLKAYLIQAATRLKLFKGHLS